MVDRQRFHLAARHRHHLGEPDLDRPNGHTEADNLRGAAWMTLGMAGYVINDAFIKLAAEDLPLFQAVLVRGLMITTFLAVANHRRGDLHALWQSRSKAMYLRIAIEAFVTVMYLTALTRLPLAGLTAFMQIVPIAVTFAAARLLRESVNIHRVIAVVVGFGGVLLIVRPWTEGFSPWYGIALLAVGFIVARELATRNISTAVPSLVVALATAIAITTLGGVLSLFSEWEPMGPRDVGLLALAATFLTVGYVASVVTIRTGDISFSAPFRYTVLIFAILLQIVVFGEVPDALTFVGGAVIAAAGLYAGLKSNR